MKENPSSQKVSSPIWVDPGHGVAYPVHVGAGLDIQTLLQAYLGGRQVFLVSDEQVAGLYLEAMAAAVASCGVACLQTAVVPVGEGSKSLQQAGLLWDRMAEQRFPRDGVVLAFGGGVVGDLAGFVAGIYHRGVQWIQIPTTLLAQVDAAVGGKTAVNHPMGKNLLGVFHQPCCVLSEVRFASSLPDRALRAGLAEVVKHALLDGEAFFSWLEQAAPALLDRDAQALEEAVRRSVLLKAAVVAADEREAGQRALLNLGHTFGHALEVLGDYTVMLHGEAVAVGLAVACRTAVGLGLMERAQQERVDRLMARLELQPALPVGITAASWRAAMAGDKKIRRGQLPLVLPRSIGDVVLCTEYDAPWLEAILQGFLHDYHPV